MSDGLNAAPRFEDPSRPGRVSNLPPEQEIRRPWLVPAAASLFMVAALALVAATVLIVIDQDAFRHTLEVQLARRQPDYTHSDIRRAVLVGVILLGVLGVLFVIGELRATQRLLDKQRSARTSLLVFTLLHLAIIGSVAQAYKGGHHVRLAAEVGAGALVLGVVLAYLWPVGRWLEASKRQGPIPLRTSGNPQD